MSSDATDDEPDDFDLPAIDDDVVSMGAAADSSGWDERLKGLPRLLHYAMLVSDNARHVEQRLVAEIDELCPNLPLNAAWAAALDTATGLALATELDHRAVIQNEPVLRSLADSVRLLCLPVPSDVGLFEEYRRVGKALLQAFNKVVHGSDDEQLCCDIERFVFGWAALPASTDLPSKHGLAAPNAAIVGMRMAEHRIAAAKATVRRQMEQQEARRNEREAEAEATRLLQEASPAAETIPQHHLVVARLSKDEMKNAKLKEIIGPLKSIINVPLPLVEVPPLQEVRNALIFEFPYAVDVIDFALADLVGRPTIRLRSLLLVGDPGGRKIEVCASPRGTARH
jgi:ATP-dependent Lon protease